MNPTTRWSLDQKKGNPVREIPTAGWPGVDRKGKMGKELSNALVKNGVGHELHLTHADRLSLILFIGGWPVHSRSRSHSTGTTLKE